MPKIDLKLNENLDPDQFKAVISDSKRLLCLADAGSGKTRMLTYRAAAFTQGGFKPQQIMMVTFTKKAAREMYDRMQKILQASYLPCCIGTFHSIACRTIRQYGEMFNMPERFAIFDSDDTKSWLVSIIKTMLKENPDLAKVKEKPTAPEIQKLYSRCRNMKLVFENEVRRIYDNPEDPRIDFYLEVVRRYETVKANAPALDFDDLLIKLSQMLDRPELQQALWNRFPALFVDEYQDINEVQHDIIRKLTGPDTYLTAVGDDAQCIYKFRGSDPRFIQNFKREFENTTVMYLPRNYRSSTQIVQNAVDILNYCPYYTGREREMTAVRTDTCPDVKATMLRNADAQAVYIARQCAMAKTRMNWSDMAILVRTNSAANKIEQALLRVGIPVSKECGIDFYKRHQINLAVKYLQFVNMTSNKAALRAVLNNIKGAGPAATDKIFDAIKQAGSLAGIEDAKVPSLKKLEDFQNLMAAFKETQERIDSGEITPFVLAEPFIELYLTPYCDALYQDDEDELKTRTDEIQELYEQLRLYQDIDAFLENAVLDNSAESMPIDNQAEPDETTPGVKPAKKDASAKKDRVKITTIHKAKGLEFKKVFLPNMSQGITPSFAQIGNEEEMEEEARVIYVAATRAMDELDITAVHANGRFTNDGEPITLAPSEFFEHLKFTYNHDSYDKVEVKKSRKD